MDLCIRLQGINPINTVVYFLEPHAELYCLQYIGILLKPVALPEAKGRAIVIISSFVVGLKKIDS